MDVMTSDTPADMDPRVVRSRGKLLDAATALLVEGGARAVTVDAVAARSQLGGWLRDAPTPADCYAAVRAGRRGIERAALADERLPEPRPWLLEDLFES